MLFSPECSINFTFADKFFITQSFPFMIVIILVAVYIVHKIRKQCASRAQDGTERWKEALAQSTSPRTVDLVVGALFQISYYSYFVLVRGSLSIFDCARTRSGAVVLESDPSIHCWEPGGVHERLHPWAVASIVVYGLGIPVACGLVLLKHRHRIQEDQALRKKAMGFTRASNPYFNTRLRYGALYADYRPSIFWWRLVLLFRKLCLAAVMVMWNEAAIFQAAVAVAVLFGCSQVHIILHPYMTDVQSISTDFTRVASEVDDPRQSSSSRRKALQSSKSIRKFQHVVEQTGTKAVRVDFNLHEAVAMFCSVALLICGMTFEASVLKEGEAAYIALTIAACGLVVVPLSLLTAVFVREVRRGKSLIGARRRAAKLEIELHMSQVMDELAAKRSSETTGELRSVLAQLDHATLSPALANRGSRVMKRQRVPGKAGSAHRTRRLSSVTRSVAGAGAGVAEELLAAGVLDARVGQSATASGAKGSRKHGGRRAGKPKSPGSGALVEVEMSKQNPLYSPRPDYAGAAASLKERGSPNPLCRSLSHESASPGSNPGK